MLELIIGTVTEAVFDYLLKEAGQNDRFRTLLQGDTQRLAFQVVLTRTYFSFKQRHSQWTIVLDHFLIHAATPLLARCLLRNRPPTGTELAQVWTDHLELTLNQRMRWIADATAVAADFLLTLDQELCQRVELQPLFDSRAFNVMATDTNQTDQSAAEIVIELQSLFQQHKHTLEQHFHNTAPNQGAQGIFQGPVTFNQPNTTFNQSGQWVQGNQYNAVQDVIHIDGDYVGGDKVGGDKISVGNVSGTGIAIGHRAYAEAYQHHMQDTIVQVFAPIYKDIASRRNDPKVSKDEITVVVQSIITELQRGNAASTEKLAHWFQNLATIAPDIFARTIAILNGPLAAVAPVAQRVAMQVQREQLGQ